MAVEVPVEAADPFDLPPWLGEHPVVWQSATSVGASGHVVGELVAAETASGPASGERHRCDVLACDVAYPQAVLDERWRREAHQAWTHAQVLTVEYDGRFTLLVPGTVVTPDTLLDAVRRLAKAVGAATDGFTVALRL